jgi:hypothetical protein
MKDPADFRREFWSLPNDAFVSREAAAAACFLSKASFESYAVHGNGPKYMGRGRGRAALYRKGDVIAWIEKSGRLVTSTAELTSGTAP